MCRIPLWLLRDLKCRHCKNFLSCGPVYVTPDCGLLCGRCRALAKPNFRNYVYEELASNFRFPCLNWEKQCNTEGPWNSLKEHEMNCPYGGSCGLMCIDPAAFFSSNRTLPNEENILYLEVPEKCLNLVSCKNCGKYLSCEPVHINVVGSNICHRCYLSNGVPPHTIRNLAYEKLAYIYRFPCIFRAKGCPIKLKFGRDSWEHEVNCHYRQVEIPSTPPTPDTYCLQPLNGIDGSGYRPSFPGSSSFNSRSSVQKRPTLDLSVLRDQAIAREINFRNQQRENKEENEKRYIKYENQPEITLNFARKESNSRPTDKEKLTDKERGVVPTHTGHVYATLTQNSILFAPPQIQPNKDLSNGIKVAKEFQDKVRRNASNASQNESFRRETIRNSFSGIKTTSIDDTTLQSSQNGYTSVSPTGNTHHTDFSGLNKYRMKDLGGSNDDYAPVVKEYVQYNPQNNVQRNESLTIGNAEMIAELKQRNEIRRKNRQQDENFNDVVVR